MKELTDEVKQAIADCNDEISRKRWIPYKGDYDKVFYDICLKDGRRWDSCWPNAGTFHNREGVVVKGKFVSVYRVSERQGE